MTRYHSKYYILFRLSLIRTDQYCPRGTPSYGAGLALAAAILGQALTGQRILHGSLQGGYHFSGLFIPRYTARVRLTFRSGLLFRKQGAPTRSTLGLARTVCRYQVPRDGACQSSTPAVVWQLPVPPVFGLVARQFSGWSPASSLDGRPPAPWMAGARNTHNKYM